MNRDFLDFQQAVAGEYSLERELGRGGMGIVYLAREVQLDRLVAIKLLPPSLAARDEIRERFLREARMAASLSHPHIVPIYRVGEAKEFVFFVMAYINGETLGERLRARGPLSAAAATRLLREVAWALSYAHGRGIVHRDIKPDNILVEAETGRALVTDFGIARGAEETALSDPGRIMGTAQFMSPEQAASEPLDGRSDFYSLGVVGYLAVSGRLPFDAPSVPALLAKHLDAAPPPLAPLVPAGIPRQLVTVIERCLRKTPDERFASGEALAEALDAASAPVRAKLPIALRVWTQSQDPMRPLYMAWSGMFTLGLLSQLLGSQVGRDIGVLLVFDLLPLVPITLFHARKTYQALSAGYTLRDLRVALATWRQERREELSFDYEAPESSWARAMRGITYGLIAGVGLLPFAGGPHSVMGVILRLSAVSGAIVAATASNVLGVRLVNKTIRSKLVGAVRAFLWNSPAGEWAARLLTPRSRRSAADLGYRPTEMALSVAASELYAALPTEFREHIPDLPVVVGRLEAHAAAARARIEELDALAGLASGERDASTTDGLQSARDAAKRELADSVVALEAVRLDLLRLHGGAADLRPITTVLEAARELGNELDRLEKAQREVDRVVPPLSIDLRPHTPA